MFFFPFSCSSGAAVSLLVPFPGVTLGVCLLEVVYGELGVGAERASCGKGAVDWSLVAELSTDRAGKKQIG